MEQIQRLEVVEDKAIDFLHKMRDMVNLLSKELKQEDCKFEIMQTLEYASTNVQEIGKELHEIIDALEYNDK
ncbi:unnamed protein product [Blepharisma stoltei]|uniref:Uncharacterized protein n=1 Tax=Blepharisma stoltei TaxID=1481888 RepID=A0AAU9ISN8_9CILI|nr:unnamed protein product [Blepharisma stoltei]